MAVSLKIAFSQMALTEFDRQASGMLTEVEQGETIIILRHGHAIAEVSPVAASQPSWKKSALRLSTKGLGLSSSILEERASEDLP